MGTRHKFLTPSISVSVPDDEPYNSDEEYFEHLWFSSKQTDAGTPAGATAQSAGALLGHDEVHVCPTQGLAVRVDLCAWRTPLPVGVTTVHITGEDQFCSLIPFRNAELHLCQKEEEEEEEMVKGPVEDEPKQLVPLGEECEKTGGPQEPAQWAEGCSEAHQVPTPEEPVERNGENVPLAEEEPSKALEPPSAEEEVHLLFIARNRVINLDYDIKRLKLFECVLLAVCNRIMTLFSRGPNIEFRFT
ncbi:UNVERIFIED_CONTAM: hypothetical protein K2H54_049453 [Gekko kuhli]